MRHEGHQDQVEQLGDDQHHDGDLDGRADVLAGVVARRQHLDGHQAHQACAVADQRQGDLAHVAVLQRTAVEQRGHQRLGKSEQAHGARHGQQHHQAQPPVQHGRVALRVVGRLGSGQLGGEHHAQRHAQQRRRKLHEPVGIEQPGHAARLQIGGDLGVDHQRDLGHAHAQQGRRHQLEDAAHAGLGPGFAQRSWRKADARQQAQARQRRQLHCQLQHAAQHHATGHGIDGLDATRLQPGRAPEGGGDHGQVQQHRRGGRDGKAPPGIEHAGRQRHQRHEADVGEHPARHQHGGVIALGRLAQAAGQQPDQQRRADHAQHAGHQQHPEQQRGHVRDQRARGLVPLLGLAGGQHRHEGLAEGPLGEQPPKEIGNPEGDIERIGQRIGSEHGGHEQIAHQPGDTGGQRQQGNGGGGFEQ